MKIISFLAFLNLLTFSLDESYIRHFPRILPKCWPELTLGNSTRDPSQFHFILIEFQYFRNHCMLHPIMDSCSKTRRKKNTLAQTYDKISPINKGSSLESFLHFDI